MKYKPYLKVITTEDYLGECAIYEPHPFRDRAIHSALEQRGMSSSEHTGINDDEWCWVYYDWCGNPIGLSGDMPDGEVVDKFTKENLGNQQLADYLNIEHIKI